MASRRKSEPPHAGSEPLHLALRFLIIAAAASAAGAVGGLLAIVAAEILVRSGHGGGLTPLAIWFVLVVSFGGAGAVLAVRWLRRYRTAPNR